LLEFDELCARASCHSEKTIAITKTALNSLLRYLESNGLPADAAAISPDIIRGYILDLRTAKPFAHHPYARPQARALSGHTINGYLRAVRAAFNRWVAEGFLEATPFSRIKLPKPAQKIIPTFSEQQLHDFFGAINASTPQGFRDYTFFLLLLDTACRLSEVTNATVEDLKLNERTLLVTGKGNRQRSVPFGVNVQKAMWKYLNLYRPDPAIPSRNYVFLTRDGRHLTNNRVEERMRHYGEKAEITGVRCSPHTLRHTACVLWLRNGGDIFTLQRITGHASLEVLRGYINLAQSDVTSAHRKHSPIDNLDLPLPRTRLRRKRG
jgi:integrase/recombinase XerD